MSEETPAWVAEKEKQHPGLYGDAPKEKKKAKKKAEPEEKQEE